MKTLTVTLTDNDFALVLQRALAAANRRFKTDEEEVAFFLPVYAMCWLGHCEALPGASAPSKKKSSETLQKELF